MPQYLDRECRCPSAPYARFDSITKRELVMPLTAHGIVNESKFCTMIQKDTFHTNSYTDLEINELTLRDVLRGLEKRKGVYHIWTDDDFCDIHGRRNLECIYVGKGEALTRLVGSREAPGKTSCRRAVLDHVLRVRESHRRIHRTAVPRHLPLSRKHQRKLWNGEVMGVVATGAIRSRH